ncbi:MAG: glutathione S-transferase family protein [Bdellovibrionales bacterium]
MIKAYVNGLSPNSRKVIATGHYLKLPIEWKTLDFSKGEHTTPEFEKINPNKKMPAIADGNFNLWESNAICCYFGELSQDEKFYPREMKARMDLLRWLNWEECHFGRWSARIAFENFIKPNFGMGAANEAAVKEATEFFHQFAKILDAQLTKGNYVTGAHLTVADFAIAAHLTYAESAKIPIGEYKNIVNWRRSLDEISAWKESAPTK